MEVDFSDRLSDLPKHMIHHIFSFLDTKDVLRTCTLSKTFLSVSKSFLVLDFDYEHLRDRMSSDEFLNNITASIQQHKSSCCFQQGTVLQKFRLGLVSDDDDDVPLPDDRFDEAIGFAIENSVKDLSLAAGDYHPFPTFAFAKSITKLSLVRFELENFNELIEGCYLLRELDLNNCCGVEYFMFSSSVIKVIDLKECEGLKGIEIDSPSLQSFSYIRGWKSLCENIDLTNCKSLKYLSLVEAPLRDGWIDQLLTQSGQVDTIKLSHCDAFKTFKVSDVASLKRIELSHCKGLEIVDIGAINLEYFTYWGGSERKEGSVSINISACKHLKQLELGGGGIPKHLLHEQLSEFLELEKMKLFLRYFHERVEINLHNLKSLSIINPSSVDIKIEAPRLDSFDYSGKLSPLYPIHHETTLNNARLGLYPDGVPDISYFLNSFEFLRHLGPCKELTLAFERNEALIFPQDLRKALISPLVDLKHMIVELQETATISTELVETLLWLSPNLETLVFESFESEQTILSMKFEYERVMNEEDICCLALPIEFSSLKDIKMEILEGVDEKDNLLKYFIGKTKSINWM